MKKKVPAKAAKSQPKSESAPAPVPADKAKAKAKPKAEMAVADVAPEHKAIVKAKAAVKAKTAAKPTAGAPSKPEPKAEVKSKAKKAVAPAAAPSTPDVSDKKVYQLRISLADSHPEIWRQVAIADSSTFWDLHVAVQDAMGWSDSHLHEFEVREPGADKGAPIVRVGIPDDILGDEVVPGWEAPVSKYLRKVGDKAVYTYDFGDDWRHTIRLEGILKADPAVTYPACTGGERACPLEDSGGVYGYMHMLEVLEDRSDPDYGEISEWIRDAVGKGGKFDPATFAPGKVVFTDAAIRLKKKFG